MHTSRHGRARMQQRSINAQIIELILDFGKATRSRGTDCYFMTKASRREMCRYLGRRRYAVISRKLGAYVILSDSGTVITAAYRNRRMRGA